MLGRTEQSSPEAAQRRAYDDAALKLLYLVERALGAELTEHLGYERAIRLAAATVTAATAQAQRR